MKLAKSTLALVAAGSLLAGACTTLDPYNSQAVTIQTAYETVPVYSSLIRYDNATAEYVPYVAESMEPSEDGMTWTLKLREEVVFGNGDPLDADTRNPDERQPGPHHQAATAAVVAVRGSEGAGRGVDAASGTPLVDPDAPGRRPLGHDAARIPGR